MTLICLTAALWGQPAPAVSGPQVGEGLAAFQIKAITGPRADQQFCYV